MRKDDPAGCTPSVHWAGAPPHAWGRHLLDCAFTSEGRRIGSADLEVLTTRVPSFTWISRATSAIPREVSTTILAAFVLELRCVLPAPFWHLTRSGPVQTLLGPVSGIWEARQLAATGIASA
jgi:hypothetical protein